MRKYYLCLLIVLIVGVTACKRSGETTSENKKATTPATVEKDVRIATFQTEGGWGYDIFINDEKYIHQEHIPAVNGMHYFINENEALRIADVVVEKIHNNIMPPTITLEDLQMNGIVIQ